MEGKFINEKLQKIEEEIIKTKAKIATFTAKLRQLENEKTARKNAEFLAIVNGLDISSEELIALIKAQKEQSVGNTTEPPNMPQNGEIINSEEDTDENI